MSAARQKRTAEAHSRYISPDSKKPRFDYRNPSTLAPDAPDEDAILELDEIGKGGQQTKRNAVNLDGYDTDSSTENFDARAEDKARLSKSEGNGGRVTSMDEDENDMFADLDDGGVGDGDEDEDLVREGKKKKNVRFMDTADIEGQVQSSKSGGHVSADFTLGQGKGRVIDEEQEESSDEGSDQERDRIGSDVDEELGAGAKKKHAPKLDAFNMKQEGEEGKFDESGNYIRKAADPDAVHDSWLEGLSKKDMKKAREAQEKRDEELRRKTAMDDAMLQEDLLATLIQHLDKGESVLEALQRLNAAKPKEKKKPKWQKKKKNGEDMDVDVERSEDDAAEIKRKAAVDAITGAADVLFSRDQPEIYEQEREMLMRQYKRESGKDWADPAPEDSNGHGVSHQWEYRWSDARDGGEHHGPYDGPTMAAWNDAGYFGEGVEFRRIGETDWSRAVSFI
ncbi:hypothetical protein M8818_005354 [Zalaria obscura]|uniref:Uncharacterized protein n=1 Tax=Zalaria obscura TaxID=2024903 RepID=A0ACC3S9N9_9PEZI